MADKGLTEEQKRKIEENRKKALERRQQKLSPQKPKHSGNSSTGQSFPSGNKPTHLQNGNKLTNSNFHSTSKINYGSNPSSNNESKPSSNFFPKPNYGKTIQPSNHVNKMGGSQYANKPESVFQHSKPNFGPVSKSQVKSSGHGSGQLSQGSGPGTVGSKVFYGNSAVKGQCVLDSRGTFVVDVGFHGGLVDIFKMMKTKSYDAVKRKWSFKLEDYDNLMKAISPLKPQVQIEPLPRAILTTFSQQLKGNYSVKEIPDADLSSVDKKLVDTLMPFQRIGVNFAIHKNGRVLIADDMGLGKTIQAICVACYYRLLWPLLIVSPSSVRFDWAQIPLILMADKGLTEEQKRKIEENRKKALERRQQKLSPQKPKHSGNSSTGQSFPSGNKPTHLQNGNKLTNSNFHSTSKINYGSNPSSNNESKPSSNFFPKPNYGKTIQPSNHVNKMGGSQYANKPESVFQHSKPNFGPVSKSQVKSSGHGSGQLSQGSGPGTVGSKVFYGNSAVKGQCVLDSRGTFVVDVGFHGGLVDIFKMMKTKSYDAVKRKWSFKLEDYDNLMKAISPLKPQVQIEPLPRAILTTFSQQLKGNYSVKEIPDADLSSVDKKLVDTLMPFQRIGVNFAIHKNGRVLIADDMGLGKTIQAICVACYYRLLWPLLIVSPSSVRFDWAQNMRRWVPSLDPQEVNVVVKGKASCTSGQVNIISYDLLARKAEELKNQNFQIVIMDECHFLKNFKTVRTKAALPVLQSARKVILLSGTPALSRPSELYTQIVAVVPGLFKFHDFGVRYCDGKQQPWGWDFSGSSNMAELQLLLEERVLIRRQKKDVLTQLPAKVRQMVLLDPASIKAGKDLQKSSKLLEHKNLKGMERRGALLEYFHHTCTAKTKAVRDYILDLLEADKKFIVFGHHQLMLDAIQETLDSVKGSAPQYIRIDGTTSSEQRSILCEKFQLNENFKAAILSITAANAGLNLAAATVVVFAELFWNPGILVQAEDRAHRMGQRDCVSVHYLVAQGTADDHIWPLIQSKLDVLSKAGLAKDNFSDADTTHMESSSKKLTEFFEESFTEDDETEGVELDTADCEKTSSHQATLSSPSPSKQLTGNKTESSKQCHMDQFFKAQSSSDSRGHKASNTGQTEDILSLAEDVDWDEDWGEDIQEPDIKKRKM